jgi:hypothetical protein
VTVEIGILGVGAIGSHTAHLLATAFGSTLVDNQSVLPENLATSRFAAADCFRPKAVVAAAYRRACGAVSRAICGDVRYAVRPGLVRALSALVLCLDNPTAIGDVAHTIWDADVTTAPMFILTCGNEATRGGYQVRVFRPGRTRLCPCCLWGSTQRQADRLGRGASCAVTSAPRASADAAEAAADAGLRLLQRWLDGDDGIAGTRTQSDGAGGEYVIRMPAAPVARCWIPHDPRDETLIELDGGIDALTTGMLAERALLTIGPDAEFVLGRRAVPMMGMRCPRCGLVTAAPLRLVPAATPSRQCGCEAALVPFATRSRVGARELAASDAASLTLRAFGSGPGEEFLAVGAAGAVRLRTRFDWKEVL